LFYARKISILLFSVFLFTDAFSQKTQFSLATDISLQRSFKKEQRYGAIGQTIAAHFHFAPKDGVYAWLSYYSEGHFTNRLIATAKSPSTVPQQVDYINNASLRFIHMSLGWKRYLVGAFNKPKGFNLYEYTGFGLMFGQITNQQSVVPDTAAYFVPVLNGEGRFKRLTFDVGLGAEYAVGGDIFVYLEARMLIPTTDYPSKYLFVNNNAPLTGAINFGVRILFD
jgi:hypothetical protein